MKSLAALVLAVACAAASAAPRERLSLDQGWRFHLGSAASPESDFGFGMTAWFSKAGEAGGPARPGFDGRRSPFSSTRKYGLCVGDMRRRLPSEPRGGTMELITVRPPGFSLFPNPQPPPLPQDIANAR